jgi:adenylate cyclase
MDAIDALLVAQVRRELSRMLASKDFEATDRLKRFLAYVVNETIEGRADRIKGYNIATSVLGRSENFDPQLDSIVRIEAGSLRRAIERYYLTAGADCCVRIVIPKGTYVPTFEQRAPVAPNPANATPADGASSDQTPAILVEMFALEGDHTLYPGFQAGLVRSLMVALARFANMRVYGPDRRSDRLTASSPPDFVLEGGVAISSSHVRVEALLLDAVSGRTVWADSFDRHLDEASFLDTREDITGSIARAIAQPYGAVSRDISRNSHIALEASHTRCAALFFRYWRTFDQDLFEPLCDMLERRVRDEPEDMEALAFLSLAYTNSYRLRRAVRSNVVDMRREAIELSERAVELSPNWSWSHYARALAYWFVNDVEGSLAALEMARKLNPNDTDIMADLGQRHAMVGDWEKAVPLLEQSFELNPAQPTSYRIGLFLYHYAHGRFQKALIEARKVATPSILYGHVGVAAAAAQLGLLEEAAGAVRRLLALEPLYGERVAQDLRGRNLRDDLITTVMEGLAKAGLPLTANTSVVVLDSKSSGESRPKARSVRSRS